MQTEEKLQKGCKVDLQTTAPLETCSRCADRDENSARLRFEVEVYYCNGYVTGHIAVKRNHTEWRDHRTNQKFVSLGV